ncbi:MAG: GAF domain-containing protein [Betaproteobacteria bacterium]|nr:GAF domain-containing protein [Betaproteobacteria bacterium]
MSNNNARTVSIPKYRFGLRGLVGLLLFSVVLLAGLTLVTIGYWMISKMEETTANEQVVSIQNTVKQKIEYSTRRSVRPFVHALAQGILPESWTLEDRLQKLPLAHSILEQSPVTMDILVGYANGDFFLVRTLASDEDRAFYNAPSGSHYVVSSSEHRFSPAKFTQLFYDKNLNLLTSRAGGPRNYDPRKRNWYTSAMRTNELVESGPLMFDVMPVAGMFYAQKTSNGKAVIAITVDLLEVSNYLAETLPTPGSKLALLRPDGTLIASANSSHRNGAARRDVIQTRADLPPSLKAGVQAYLDGARRSFNYRDLAGRSWAISTEEFALTGKPTVVTVLAIPLDELPHSALDYLRYAIIGMGCLLLIVGALQFIVTRSITRPLRALARSMHDTKWGDAKEAARYDSNLAEISALSDGIRHMKSDLGKLLSIAETINAESDFGILLGRILQETLAVTQVDGGMIFLLDSYGAAFSEGCICWTHDTGSARILRMEDVPQETQETGIKKLLRSKLTQISIARDTHQGLAEYLAPGFDDPTVERIDMICVPLHNQEREQLGVLALFRAIKPAAQTFQPQQIAFIEALANTTAVALEKQSLIKAQIKMRDTSVRIIAEAIDAKSPYTGGHCHRVPIIFQMFLEAACTTSEGPLKDFTLDAGGWEESRLAAWLHDWGKVGTPEYIVDKATKLETKYDRIHEIRTRFEVLKRDAEIAALRAILAGADAQAEFEKLAETWAGLDDDFAFVASCNTGTEYLNDAAIARLRSIAGRTWQRTLDKRFGLAREELARIAHTPNAPLPVTEQLLMDRPEHLIERGPGDKIPANNPKGFKLHTPPYLYNLGELYNLSVRRGTLTEEDRYKINDHITQTINMLEALPLPKELRNVPEIAGAHHERVDGKGYPRGLVREQMSWRARMLAIADIFEALTAADRPYKPSKPLSEALAIMAQMKAEGHIDPDLYDLFLAAGIPQRYAKQHLPPGQNDL